MTKIILRTLLQCIFVFQIGANSSFSEAPRSVEYIREGDDISLKWTYTIGSGDTLDYVLWKSYDPAAGSSTTDDADQFRLVVKTTSQVVVLPDKAKGELKGVNLYEGRVSMKDQATLEIRNVTLDNTYICELSYVDGGGSHSIKTQVRVIPTVPPQIINSSFSSPLDVVEGNDVIVNCSATGKPAPNVTWTNSPGNEKLNQSVSSALLVIKNTRRDGNKDYTCTANGVGNTVSKNLQLNVLFPPSIAPHPDNQTVTEGGSVSVLCGVTGNQVPSVQWKRDGQQVSGSGTLSLTNIRKQQAGGYTCETDSNTAGPGASATIYITVQYSPSISPKEQSVVVNEGRPAILTVNVAGVPKPTLEWTQIGGDNSVLSRSSIYNISIVLRSQAGEYQCKAQNGIGPDATARVSLTVKYKPEIDTDLSNSTVGSWEGNSLTLDCVARGVPPPTFNWFKPGDTKLITNTASIPDGSRVTVTTSSSADYGKYKCRTTNDAGSVEHNITVNHWYKPGQPLKITLKEKEASYVRLTWTPPAGNGGSDVIDYRITIQENINDAQIKEYKSVAGIEKLIDQLTPGAAYSVSVYARNIVGFGDAALTVFTTKSRGKPGIPMLRDIKTKISTTDVELTWSAAAENGGEILTYTVWWREVDKSGGVGRWFARNTSSNAITYKFIGLEFDKTYEFGITAWNQFGQSALDKENGLKQVEVFAPTAASPSAPGESKGVNAAAIGGGAAAAIIIILVVVVVIVVLKRRKASPGKAGESRDPLGGSGDEGYMSVSKASAARRLGRNNANNEEAGIPTYATVDMSKKTPKKPDLIYAELADFNNSAARAASMNRREQPKGYEPTDYAEIAQFGRPSAEPMYDNVPRY